MQVAADDRDARELIALRRERERNLRLAERKPASMEDILSKVKSGQKAMVNLVVKTDVQGSYEALRKSLEKLSNDEVQIRVIGGGVGGINESDATLAAASGAILIGFNTRADASARTVIQEQSVDLHYYSVIYDAIDMVRGVGSGLLAPEVLENIIGLAEVKDVFRSPRQRVVQLSMVWSVRARLSGYCAITLLSSKASWNRCVTLKTTSTKFEWVRSAESLLRITMFEQAIKSKSLNAKKWRVHFRALVWQTRLDNTA